MHSSFGLPGLSSGGHLNRMNVSALVCTVHVESRRVAVPLKGCLFPSFSNGASFVAIQHHLWLRTYNSRLANSPKRERAARVLDCGTGTGHWASAFGEDLPLTHSRILTINQFAADDHPEAVVRPAYPSLPPPPRRPRSVLAQVARVRTFHCLLTMRLRSLAST